MTPRILIIDDAEGVRRSLEDILGDEGYRVLGVSTAAEARASMAREAVDLVLLDLHLPDSDGLELLAELGQDFDDLAVIVITGHGNVDSAVEATRLGAYDYLEKPLSMSRVLLTVRHALERARMNRRLEVLSSHLQRSEKMIGESPPMRRLKSQLARAASSDSRILVMGENGTGKELVARQAHQLSPRASQPFVEVNCAAIPEELIESELFGHVKGSFTGASADRAGRFEQADGGTLFLDEIADMSIKTQAKVLRVLQEQRFERVGGTTSLQVDVRVLAATNKDLETEIREGRFREDLYFRLAVIPLHVPPLRERHGDIPRLVEHFLARTSQDMGRRAKRMDASALEALERYDWPGNVRELRNFVERMQIMVPGDTIQLRDLPPNMRQESGDRMRGLLDESTLTLKEARATFEKRMIERRLEALGGNVSRTAHSLGIERSHLYRKIKAYHIDIERGSQEEGA